MKLKRKAATEHYAGEIERLYAPERGIDGMTAFRLTPEEAWAALAEAHTGMHTTLRRDGRPITLPVWHVVIDEAIYLRTPDATSKLARIRNDPRGFFLIETGRVWAELAAVTVAVHATILEPGAEAEAALQAHEAKYAGLGPDPDALPDAVRDRYGSFRTVRLDPTGRLNSWNNRALVGDDRPIEWT